MAQGNFVAYYRVSTARQGRSGLGLEAQRRAVTDFLNGGSWELLAEIVEVESDKDNDREQLGVDDTQMDTWNGIFGGFVRMTGRL